MIKAIALSLALVLPLAACKKSEAPVAEAPAVTSYQVKGKIVNFQSEGRVVVIDHETIPGFMEAMSMPFELKDAALGQGLKKGDKVDFTLEVSDNGALITALGKAK